MPAGMVRPRASLAPVLGAGAIAEYGEAGWLLSEHGRVESGIRTGRCGRCAASCVRYGPTGSPLCSACSKGVAA